VAAYGRNFAGATLGSAEKKAKKKKEFLDVVLPRTVGIKKETSLLRVS